MLGISIENLTRLAFAPVPTATGLALEGPSIRFGMQCAYSVPCRFPNKSISSIEGYNLFVPLVCRDAGIPYHHGEKTVTYTACILIE